MNLTLTPAPLKGAIMPPPSKSQAHRLILAAALADGESVIENMHLSQDMQATLRCIELLGARFTFADNVLTVQGMQGKTRRLPEAELPLFDCGESGSTLRFMIPIALAVLGGGRFTGHGRLMQRPQDPYFQLFDKKGITWHKDGDVLTICGDLKAGDYELPGDVSSQFFTGLLYALPLLPGESRIISTTELQSHDYVDLTREVLKTAGIPTEEPAKGHFSCSGTPFKPIHCAVENDWSQAGFWYAARFLGEAVEITGMNEASSQGDKVIVPFLKAMVEAKDLDFNVSDCPDLVPPLAAAAALRKPGSQTLLSGAERLRIKESDRLKSVHDALAAMGADIEEMADALKITAVPHLKGNCSVDAANDHRIAMMTAIAAIKADAPVKIIGAECVAKSYPDFWECYAALGGNLTREEA